MSLTQDEQILMDALLAGRDPLLETLRRQAEVVQVQRREFTGSGFFSDLSVPDNVVRVTPARLHIGDLWFEIPGNESGGEAILFIKDGALNVLEAYAHDGSWPAGTSIGRVHYFGGTRDVGSLRRNWGA